MAIATAFLRAKTLAIAFVILALMLPQIAALVGAWLLRVVMIPLCIALLWVIFAVMFGVMYSIWRDVCTDPADGAAHEVMVG